MGFTTRSAVLLLLGASVALAGCKKEAPQSGQWTSCTCPYLTDFDDIAKHQLDVCVHAGEKADDAAFRCASNMTHGPSEKCTCEAPSGPCDGKELCRSKEYK